MNFKKYIADKINVDMDKQQLAEFVTPTAEGAFGDFAFPCFRLAKTLRSSPIAIAEKLQSEIVPDEVIEKAEAVNGYLNFYLRKQKTCTEAIGRILPDEHYGSSNEGEGKTICIDYSSVNIAKPFHIGHLSTTAIGSSLYKLYKFLGYNVIGINHLGDWGTQFGKLIVAYKLWSNKDAVEKGGVDELQRIYVKFHIEEESNAQLTTEAREWFSRIEKGDVEAQELLEFFKRITLTEVEKIYKRLNVEFDSWNGESFYNDKMQPILDLLTQKGLVTTSEGAKIVDLTEYGMSPCLLIKSDGSSLYATRDLAAAMYRKETYDFYKCLYVVAYQQNLHFKQIFKVLELAGLPWANDLVHVAYGMVSLEDGAMSTRKGNAVWLRDVLDKAVAKSYEIINDKNPDLENKEEVAEQVGVGAVIFSALENARIKDIVFTFERVLNFEGETAPYIQYTYARCCSLFAKAGVSYYARIVPDYSALDNAESAELSKYLLRFPEVVRSSAEKYEPSFLANYLIDLAQLFNKFYFEQRILDENIARQNARLQLVACTQRVLATGLGLLGISAPQKM